MNVMKQPSNSATRLGLLGRFQQGGIPLLAALLLLTCGSVDAQQRDESIRSQPPVTTAAVDSGRTDRLIIKMRNTMARASGALAARASIQVAGNRAGVRLAHLRATGLGGAHVMKLDRSLDRDALQRLADDIRLADPDVEYVEPDLVMSAQWVPNDSFYWLQWNFHEATAGINLPPAWDLSKGDGVVVAVIDTGVRPHADFAGRLLPGYDFISSSVDSNDGDGRDADARDPGNTAPAGACQPGSPFTTSTWHGTHVAGTVAAATNNNFGVAGVAPAARILPVRVLGRCGGYTSDIMDGLIWASGGTVAGAPTLLTPAKVVNLSLGGFGECGLSMREAIQSARSRGVVVVASAGNKSKDVASFTPASCPGVITVAAVGRDGALASYSNYGDLVDVAAPGGSGKEQILSLSNTGYTSPGIDFYTYMRGTSMAAPHVSGVVALMFARNPELTPDQVEQALRSSASQRGFPVPCARCGSGIVDARRAVEAAGLPSAPVSRPQPWSETEPNDTAAAANQVRVFPSQMSGTIGRVGDKDRVSVVIASGQTLSAVLQPVAGTDHDLLAHDDKGILIASGTSRGSDAERLSVRNTGTSSVTINLTVQAYSKQVGPGASYTLTLSF